METDDGEKDEHEAAREGEKKEGEKISKKRQ